MMIRPPNAFMALLYICVFFTVFTFQTFGQTDTLVVATYNILNYPGTDAAIRNPFFRRVIHTMKPDVMVVQEMLSQTGVTTFLNEVMNKYQAGLYSTVPFNDGPDTDNSFYYRSDKVTYLGAQYINTALRQIAEYTFRHNNSGEVIKIYSLHLKASTGYESDRLAEVTILRNLLNAYPSGTNFIIGGDYNIYTSTEPAYQKLIGSEADNDGRCFDPKTLTGTWNQSAYALHHTQSPRVRAFGGGSTGGMDDRFDMLLNSASLTDNLISASYKAYGNDGNHYNDSINRLPNTAVHDSVAHGLHYAADHIPVVAKYVFQSLTAFNLLTPSNNSLNQSLTGLLTWQASTGATGYDVYFGTSNPPTTIVSSNQTSTSYSYGGTAYNTTYYWKVVAKNSTNTLEATGSPWNFKTLALAAPGSFNLLLPTNGAINQSRSGSLTWSSSSQAAGYDVYLDTLTNPLTIVSSNQTATSFEYVNLTSGETFYWKVVARNATGTTVGTGSPRSFTIANVPAAPSGLVADDKSDTQISLIWVDNANDELGYRVYRQNDIAKSNVSGDLPPNTTAYTDTNLLPNAQYFYDVLAFNQQGEGNFVSLSSYTLAAIPDIKDMSIYGTTSIYVVIEPRSNPSLTEYAIIVTSDSLEDNYVQLNGTIGADPVWKTYSAWNENVGVQVVGLISDTKYFIKVLARNADNDVNSMIDFKYITTGSFSVSRNANQGWNLHSVPVERTDLRKVVVFPFANSSAFAYQGGYSIRDTLEYGRGYWLKYNSSISIEVGGTEKYSDTIPVAAGWNLIGSISSPVAVANIIQDPPGVIASGYWAYDNGYYPADTLKPMLAYWLKANSAGSLLVDTVNRLGKFSAIKINKFDNYNSLTFKDGINRTQTIYFSAAQNISAESYELPPVPPKDAFDVRFKSGRFVESFIDKTMDEISISSNSSALNIEWRIIDGATYTISPSGSENIVVLKDKGIASVDQANIESLALKLVSGNKLSGEANISPSDFHLYPNYPNPFNPSTQISYSIPEECFVTLKVFDVMGRETAALINKVQSSGNYSVQFDAGDLSGGVYFYKLSAGKYSEFRKMILIK